MRHAVIMAGGSGTRLWPVSRQSKPKQFQQLIGEKTLLQQTFERINPVIPAENIWVMTGKSYVDLVAEQLPQINKKHIIGEPTGRNTAPATLLATLAVLAEDPTAILFGLLPADHYVGQPEAFVEATESLLSFIEINPEYIGTIGIYPTEPNTGYGYIKKGPSVSAVDYPTIFRVDSFREKPDKPTAEQFLESGHYLWNGGYFLFNGAQMVNYYQKLAPVIYDSVRVYHQSQQGSDYEKIPAEPIDKAIAEKLDQLVVIPAEMDWSDVGNWATLHEILTEQGQQNQSIMGKHLDHGSKDTFVFGGSKLIATVGLENIAIIDTDDVLLVCNKNNVQDVKKIVEQLQAKNQQQHL